MRSEFQQERQSGIGSSDMPAILGISPFRSAVDVYLEKIGERPASPVSPAMRFGLKVEPIIADEYEEMTDSTLNRRETFYRHPDHEWFITHPDRFVQNDGGRFTRLVELKSVGPWMTKRRDREGGIIGENMWGEPGTDEVPEYVIVELQHRLEIINTRFGIEYADIAAFFRGPAETKIYTVKYDPELGKLMLDRAMKFWFDHVLKKQPPAMDGSPAATELLKRKFPRSEEIELTATPKVQIIVDTLKAGYRSQTAVNKEVAKLEQDIRFVMGTAGVLNVGDERITWKQDRPGQKIDYKAIVRAFEKFVPATDSERIFGEHTEAKEGARRFLPPRHWKKAEE